MRGRGGVDAVAVHRYDPRTQHWNATIGQRSATMSPTSASAAPKPAAGKPIKHLSHESQSPPQNAYLDLFFVSFAILFLEMACIRWFGSAVLFLTFFTNLVLMACFLGMSVGLLTAGRRKSFVAWVIPLAVAAVAMAELTTWAFDRFGNVAIDVGGQGSPQQVFFGTEGHVGDVSRFVVP